MHSGFAFKNTALMMYLFYPGNPDPYSWQEIKSRKNQQG
jgi:hypothetical protein